MDLTQDKLDLIAKIIKNDRKFADNEDLYDDFFNETCKRSLGIVKIVSSDAALEAYIKKIATTAILNVLKDSGRLRRTKTGYTPSKEIFKNHLLKINEEEPEKQYLQIYKLRYDKGMTQKEISNELGLSQSEISKRLFNLMKKLKQFFR